MQLDMTRVRAHLSKVCLSAILAIGVVAQAHAGLVVDRGLPDSNLNNAAGGDRSNVSWGFAGDYLSGDDFNLGGSGNWQIDQLSLWIVGGEATLGDRFSSISLFLGPDGGTIPLMASANLAGNTSDNANVSVTQVNYPGTTDSYQGTTGGFLNIWQIDFFNLGTFNAGQYLFSLGGEGDGIAFLHASNAALSGTPQDGSDDLYRWFSGNASDPFITPGGPYQSNGLGWDKSSDVNVQVYATSVATVSEPSLMLLMGLGFMGLLYVNRRRYTA